MAPDDQPRNLTTLEMTVLGLTWLRGPCTIYAVMKVLSMAGSSYHNSRAGAAYSVAHRLLDKGLLKRVDDIGNVSLSTEGLSAINKWIGPGVPQADIAHSADLIRLRFYFLGAIEPEQRLAFIDASIEGLREFLAKCESLVKANEEVGEFFGGLATLASILETRARIDWLKLARSYLVSAEPEDASWGDRLLRSLPEWNG